MLISLSGPDGTGKTTIINSLKNDLQKTNQTVDVVWLRFNHYISRIINIIGRLTGKSFYENYKWGRLGYHNYEGLIGILYIFAVWFDHHIFAIFFKKRKIKIDEFDFILIDRYVVDTVADLLVDTSRHFLVFFLFSGIVKHELNESNAYILYCNYDMVVKRRPDIKDDKFYYKKIKAYKCIAQRFSIPIVNTGNFSVEECVSQITKGLKNHFKPQQNEV